jgi:hypothetical protein
MVHHPSLRDLSGLSCDQLHALWISAAREANARPLGTEARGIWQGEVSRIYETMRSLEMAIGR